MKKTEKNIIKLPSAEDIEAEAASWLTVLGREDGSFESAASFKKWLNQSDRHREAFDALSALWGELEILKELDDIIEVSSDEREPEVRHHRREIFAAAASIAVVAGLGGVLLTQRQRALNQTGVFSTMVGKQKTIKLSDGSSVQLNTDSKIETVFSREERAVRLLHGEAHFDVAKDAERPFTVFAATGMVRAIGTAFSVRLRRDSVVDVIVDEGRVSLSVASEAVSADSVVGSYESAQPIAVVSAGQNAAFNQQLLRFDEIQTLDLTRKLAWRQGMLVYEGEPLADVVADISRYTDINIEIVDPAIRELPVGGYFKIGELEALFDSLEVTFGLKVEHIDESHVRLSMRA